MHSRTQTAAVVCLCLGLAAAAGCAPTYNLNQPASESETLGGITQLTYGFASAVQARFSPDMRWIMFQARPAGDTFDQVYIAHLKWQDQRIVGTDLPIRISPAGSGNICGTFSPDGNSLAFASTGGGLTGRTSSGAAPADTPTVPPAMELYRADGWAAALAAADPSQGENLARHPITHSALHGAQATYLPDGRWLCFTSARPGDAGLFIMRPDGSDRAALLHADGIVGAASFSPDGQRMAYCVAQQHDSDLHAYVADVKADAAGRITAVSSPHPLCGHDVVVGSPTWDPDGRHIVCAIAPPGADDPELYIMRSDGRLRTRITHHDGLDANPVFSPDGRWLMWTSQRSADGTGQIYVARFHRPRGM